MINKNLGRFYTHLAFSEWDGYQVGNAKQDFHIKMTDSDSSCEVYVFEPSFPGEAWNILVLLYNGSQGLGSPLKTRVDYLADQLGATLEEAYGD